MRNISVKLFSIWTSGLDDFKDFLSRALAALMFSRLEPFMQFW